MTSTSRRFVLAMVRACLPLTAFGIRFRYGADYMSSCYEYGGNGSKSGELQLYVEGMGSLYVAFSLIGKGDGVTWTSGRCAISVDGQDGTKEFFCERQDDDGLRVRTMAVMRQGRSLNRAVRAALNNLGISVDAVSRQLRNAGFTADSEGLVKFLGEVFALTDVEIHAVNPAKTSLLEIRGHRIGNPDLELRIRKSSGPVHTLMSQELPLLAETTPPLGSERNLAASGVSI